ncbi:hypothetical protein CLCR_08563 [Cladophialophora carrionii]|uniref:Uncharacterized protein n=1 Tax=Cladophialophora carrionii TaxID=86049 RepID=A0A1C1CTY9_9EURO|nr:hypothetical protein CLCR_08563 [Cladophialophora carrionii]
MQTLHEVIEDGSFWLLPDRAVLELIRSEFPQELERLKNATFVRSSDAPRPQGPSIAESLYGQDYPEINRTLVGVLALRWLHNDDYDRFIGTQGPPPIVLKRQSFAWLRSLFDKGLKSIEDTYTLIVSMVTNDLGKDPALAADYAKKVGVDISKVNHDMILYHAVEEGMVPALDRLTKQARDYLLLGIKLGSDFNFGQLAQAENAPASLSGLLDMRGHDRAFEMRFMEQILDLAGAAGHEDWTCARKMVEPIFQSYRNVYDVAHGIIYEQMPLREGYDIILRRKLALLHQAGYSRQFDITQPGDRALMRLFCLGNTSNAENADIFFTAFTERISPETRSQLTHGLNVDGSVEEPAVQPTYIPAMLTKAIGNTATGSQREKITAVAAMLRFLGRCFVVEPQTLQRLPRGVTVIERDVRKIIPVLESDEFKRDPDVLDKESIPESQVANMAPGLEVSGWEDQT